MAYGSDLLEETRATQAALDGLCPDLGRRFGACIDHIIYMCDNYRTTHGWLCTVASILFMVDVIVRDFKASQTSRRRALKAIRTYCQVLEQLTEHRGEACQRQPS
jgi:hypothetical protein